jgi:hypothetical protein
MPFQISGRGHKNIQHTARYAETQALSALMGRPTYNCLSVCASCGQLNQHYCSIGQAAWIGDPPALIAEDLNRSLRELRRNLQRAGFAHQRPLVLVATLVAFAELFGPSITNYLSTSGFPAPPSCAKRNICKASTLRDMQRIILDRRSLADAVLSWTINHNTIAPMFLTGCERICDPLVPRAILGSACLGSSSVERSAGNGVGRANAVRQSSRHSRATGY